MAMGLITGIQPETLAQANPAASMFAQGEQAIGQGINNELLQNQIPLAQAQTASAYAMLPYIPYKAMGEYYGGLGKFLATNPALSFIKAASNDPQMQAQIANNPQLAGYLNNAINTVGYMGGGGYLSGMFPGIYPAQGNPAMGNQIPGQMPMGGQQPQAQSAPMQSPDNSANRALLLDTANQLGITPQQQQPAPQGSAQGQQAVANALGINPQQLPNVPTSQLLPPDVATTQSVSGSLAAQKTYTPQQIQQIAYDNSATNMFNRYVQSLPAISSFSGLQGQLEYKRQQALDAAGKPTSPQYQAYKQYQESAQLMANDIRRTFGEHATNSQQESLNELIDPVKYNLSPRTTLGMAQSLINAMHDNTKAITQPISMNIAQAQNQPAINVPGAPATAANPTIQIPNFPNKQAFLKWFNAQNSTVQQAVRAQLATGGK